MPGSSRIIESPLSGGAAGASSRVVVAPHSGSAGKVSSRCSGSLGGFATPPLSISNVTWPFIGYDIIKVAYETNHDTKCTLLHKEYPDGYFWIKDEFPTFHESPHLHTIDGLQSNTYYAIRIIVENNDGDIAYSPSQAWYYIVQTDAF